MDNMDIMDVLFCLFTPTSGKAFLCWKLRGCTHMFCRV